MKKYLVLSALALAACSGEPTPSQQGGVATVEFTRETTRPLLGFEAVAIKIQDKKDPSKVISRIIEVQNVPCKLTGDVFKAEFIAPKTVQVPDYGKASSPITVTCTHRGITRSATVSIFDATAAAAARQASAGSDTLGGALAGVLAGSIVGIDRKGRNDYKYPPITIAFN